MNRVNVACWIRSSDGSHSRTGASLMAPNRRLPPVPSETSQTLVAPFTGTVVATPAPTDARVAAGTAVVVIEAMKMEHEIVADRDATVAELHVGIGDTVTEGQPLATITSDGQGAGTPTTESEI